jgi:hypothetical protein
MGRNRLVELADPNHRCGSASPSCRRLPTLLELIGLLTIPSKSAGSRDREGRLRPGPSRLHVPSASQPTTADGGLRLAPAPPVEARQRTPVRPKDLVSVRHRTQHKGSAASRCGSAVNFVLRDRSFSPSCLGSFPSPEAMAPPQQWSYPSSMPSVLRSHRDMLGGPRQIRLLEGHQQMSRLIISIPYRHASNKYP